MERAALAPHPRWRRFVARVTQPRVLIAIGIGALLLGGAAIYASEELLRDGGEGDGPRAGAIDRADVTVAVLNGTSVNGLAGNVGSDIEASGYVLGSVSSTTPGVERTAVLYADGQKRAAQKVARDLGVDKATVEAVDRETRRLAGDADVVVIAGRTAPLDDRVPRARCSSSPSSPRHWWPRCSSSGRAPPTWCSR